MRKTVVVVLSTLGLLFGLTLQANAAAKPAYKVTLRTSVTKSTAEHFIVVSGKVTGPKASGHVVTIQRRYDGGSWISVTTAEVQKSGKYSARVETPRGGWTSFRALKGSSSVRKAGASTAHEIPVYQWISLASEAGFHNSDIQPGVQETIGGKSYAAIDVYDDTDFYFKLGDKCTMLSTLVQYSGPNGAQSIDLTFAKNPNNGGPATPVNVVVPTGSPITMQTSLVGARSLGVFTANYDSSYKLVLANPRVYCNADHLPLWALSELV